MQPRGERSIIISFRLEHLLGWGLTLLICLVPVFLWLQIHPLSTIHGFSGLMLSMGRLVGLVGMVLYALNLVYATRLSFLEYLFGGLNRVYIAHHLLGGFALILLSFHPVFLSLRLIQVSFKDAALLLLPNGLTPLSALFNTQAELHSVVLEQWAVFFGIIAFWGMVVLLLVTFFIKLPYGVWLFTHKFLGAAFFLAGLHVLFVTSDTSTHPALRYYMLAMAALGIAAFAYKTLMGSILIRRYRYRVDAVKTTAGNVYEIAMSPLNNAMSYKPGQFVFIRFIDAPGLSKEWHPFSIASGSSDGKLILGIKGLGDYTNSLARLSSGATAEIEGAYGRFSYTNFHNLNQIWVAGGIGITPFLSMARSLPKDKDYKIDLYYSVKSESELIDWDNLYDIALAEKGKFRVIPYVAEKEKGFLTADFIESKSGGVAGKEIFICGPPPMMKGLRQQLRQKSVPNVNIHSEEFAMS